MIGRLLSAFAVAIVAAVGGYAVAVAVPPPGILGTYTVPMGTLTVERDGTARYVPAVTFIPAVAQPQEDEPGWDCRRHGNHICEPGGEHAAGCYVDGELVIPWTDYRNPERDPLYGHVGTCKAPRKDVTDIRA